MAATDTPSALYTLRATGKDSHTEDGTPRVMHGDNFGDLRVMGLLSRFDCEIVNNTTGEVTEL